MKQASFFLTSTMEKVFPDEKPQEIFKLQQKKLRGEALNFQLVFNGSGFSKKGRVGLYQIEVNGVPKSTVKISTVTLVPSRLPVAPLHDEDYLRTNPGLYPDLLEPVEKNFKVFENQYRSLYIQIDTSQLKKSNYTIEIVCQPSEEELELNSFKETISLEVSNLKLPKEKLIHTEWFYIDCLANYYNVEPYSNKGWKIIRNFLDYAYNNCHVNLILTPIFTPPLDTEIGSERRNVQLLTVSKKSDSYEFDFEKLRIWCQICKNIGIENLEMPHLFTQWGALATPNIYDEKGNKLFGWDVPATSKNYKKFLETLIPQLMKVLAEEGYSKEHIYFHISDEPRKNHLLDYKAAKRQVEDLLKGYKKIDALSEYEFYKEKLVEHPVVANNYIQDFINHDVPNLWVYYCTSQNQQVPNRFFALPNYRNRVMGILMYIYQIEGFLHWGFNFYNSLLSRKEINPFYITDADEGFPSGDPFLVYPGKNGQPLGSIRNEAQMEGFQDLAILQLLETKISREKVLALIEDEVGYLPTFSHFPKYYTWFDVLREKAYILLNNSNK